MMGRARRVRRAVGGLTAALLAGLVAAGPMAAAAPATALTGAAAATPSSTPASAALPRWTGGMDLYRPGVYTMQATWIWCTAANAQIMRNMVDHQADHGTANQARYFAYMRAHNRYAIPVTDGSDPQGWADGLARYVDSRYRLVTYASFDSALHDAVTRMRQTGLPVSLAVMHGNHAWVLNGFTATADPAVTSRFAVTSVRVTGPLYGRQSVHGYDMAPDTRLTTAAFRGFFTQFHYAPLRMAWEGRYVTIQPLPRPAGRPAVSIGATSTGSPPASPSSSVAGIDVCAFARLIRPCAT
jgi:hypothetical protein